MRLQHGIRVFVLIAFAAHPMSCLGFSNQIKPKDIGEVTGITDTSICAIKSKPDITYSLYKTDKMSPVAMLSVTEDGTAIMNPNGYVYPKELDISKLTQKEVFKLWGKPLEKTDCVTFNLSSQTFDEPNIFHIDAKFSDNQLQSYRVRGIGITKATWATIKRGGVDPLPQ